MSYDNIHFYCARCLHRLRVVSEEEECERCGEPIEETDDYLTEQEMEAAKAALRDVLAGAIKDGLIRETT